MSHPLEEIAAAYVLDELETSERRAFEARLRDDPELRALVQELENALTARLSALPLRTPSSATWEKIAERITPQANRRPFPARQSFGWAFLGGVAALLMLAIVWLGYRTLHPANATAHPAVVIVRLASDRTSVASVPLRPTPKNADARFIQLASLAEQYWERPEKLPVGAGMGGHNGRGYALFDPGSNQGFIAVQQLPPPQTGEQYHLWIVDTANGATRDAGILPLTATTRGLFFFSMPDAPEPDPKRLGFYVTVEETTPPRASKVVLGQKPF